MAGLRAHVDGGVRNPDERNIPEHVIAVRNALLKGATVVLQNVVVEEAGPFLL